MVCAARFRPPHISCIVSAVCCTLHAVFSCLPSVCVVRRMLRAGCCPLHECLLRVGCCSLRPASNVRLLLHLLPPSTAPRHALRSGTERGVLHRTTAWGNRCAAHRMPSGSHLGDYSLSTVAVLSVAIVAWQAATAGGVSRTAHVPSRTFKPTALSHVPCCRCARLHFACRRQTLETPSPRFREGSRHTTATSTVTLPAHSLCSPHVPMPPHFQC